MLSLGHSINNLVSKLGRVGLLEICDWSADFDSFNALVETSGLNLIAELGRLLNKNLINERIKTLVTLLYLINTGYSFTQEDYNQIFFSSSRLYEDSSRRIRRLTNLLMCQIAIFCEHAFMLQSLANYDLTQADEWRQANAFKMFIKVCGVTQTYEAEIRNALTSRRSYLILNLLVAFNEQLTVNPQIENTLKYYNHQYYNLLDYNNKNNDAIKASTLLLLLNLHRSDTQQLLKLMQMLQHNEPFLAYRLISLYKLLLMSNIDYDAQQKVLQCVLNNAAHTDTAISLEALRLIVNLMEKAYICTINLTTADLMLADITLMLVRHLNNPLTPVKYSASCMLYRICKLFPALVRVHANVFEQHASEGNVIVSVRALLTLMFCDPIRDKKNILKRIRSRISELSENLRIELIDGLCQLGYIDDDILNFLLTQVKKSNGGISKLHTGLKLCELCEINLTTKRALTEHCIESLCELIEDCSHQRLLCYLITFLAKYIPETVNPESKVRAIMNRIILESDPIRLCSISSLFYLVQKLPFLKNAVVGLFQMNTYFDADDEIRSASRFFIETQVKSLENKDSAQPDLSTSKQTLANYISEFEMAAMGNLIELEKHDYAAIIKHAQELIDNNIEEDVDLSILIKTEISHENLTLLPNVATALEPNLIAEKIKNALKDSCNIELGVLEYTSQSIQVTGTEEDLLVIVTLHHFQSTMFHFVIEFKITNSLEYASCINTGLVFKVIEGLLFDVKAATQKINISANESGSIYVLMQLKAEIQEFDQRFSSAIPQILFVELFYDCLEDGAQRPYQQSLKLQQLDFTALVTFRSNTEPRSLKDLNTESVEIKVKCNASFHTANEVILKLKKSINLRFDDDPETANLFTFSGESTFEPHLIDGSIHVVESSQGLLMRSIVYCEKSQLANFLANYIEYLIK